MSSSLYMPSPKEPVPDRARGSVPSLKPSVVDQAAWFDYVRFTFPDLHGLPRGKAVPKRHVPQYIDNWPGMSVFHGTYYFGITSEVDLTIPSLLRGGDGLGNSFLKVCDDRVYELPWAGGEGVRVGEVMCETAWSSGEPQEACPRYIARRQLEKLTSLGYNFLSATEVEFHVYRHGDVTSAGDHMRDDDVMKRDDVTRHGDVTRPIFHGNGTFSHYCLSRMERWLYELEAALMLAGVDVETVHPEYGPGQVECVLHPVRGMRAPDAHFRMKEGVKEFFQERACAATFMTLPAADAACSGAHFNHSLWRSGDGGNAFHDPEREDKLSDVARHWIAGLLRHLPALTAISCPTVNCYRRIGGPWCPDKADWGIDARTASIRAKNNSPQATYVENRVPSAAANPYLVFAGTIAAGLDGITNKLECPPQKQGDAPLLPRSLSAAIATLKDDAVMCGALGPEFIETFAQIKQRYEVDKFKTYNMQGKSEEELEAERKMYFNHL